MRIIHNRLIPLPGFSAINLFGLIFVRQGHRVDNELIRHEAIHTRQMREMCYLPFYFWYLTEWMLRLLYACLTLPMVTKQRRRRHLYDAYAHLLFEQEAYRHASETDYLSRRKHYAWLIEPLSSSY